MAKFITLTRWMRDQRVFVDTNPSHVWTHPFGKPIIVNIENIAMITPMYAHIIEDKPENRVGGNMKQSEELEEYTVIEFCAMSGEDILSVTVRESPKDIMEILTKGRTYP